MQMLTTHGTLPRTRVLQSQRWQRVLALLLLTLVMTVVMTAASGTIYHLVSLQDSARFLAGGATPKNEFAARLSGR